MTHDDLATLLREHVAGDEPTYLSPAPAIERGRRRLRGRRLATTGAAVAVLAVGGVIGVPLLSDGDRPGTAMDPASAAALARYDAAAMPELMDAHVRPVLERGAPALGASTFVASDSQGQELPQRLWDKASGLTVSYGEDAHDFDVSISHARSEAEGDPERFCSDGLDGGYYLECTVSRTADGDVVISQLEALRHFAHAPADSWMVVPRTRLRTIPLDRLYFGHTVKVVKSETLVTYVQEHVKATDRDPANAGFTASYADLAEIGTDPVLVMPVPPPGENGCPAYTMPPMEVSCE